MKKNRKKKKKNNKGFGAYEFLTVAVVCLVLTAILLVAILKLSNKEKYQVFNFNARVMAMNAINYNFKDEGTIYLYEMLKLDLISPIKNPFNGKNCGLYESKVEFLKEGKKGVAVLDGIVNKEFDYLGEIKLKKSENSAYFVRFKKNFYNSVNNKLIVG